MRRGRLALLALVAALSLAAADSAKDEQARASAEKDLDEAADRLAYYDREVAVQGKRLADIKAALESVQNDADRATATAKLRELQREQKEMQKKQTTRKK